ncbi:MAG: META domain-containing protein [Thermochromatium sp.]
MLDPWRTLVGNGLLLLLVALVQAQTATSKSAPAAASEEPVSLEPIPFEGIDWRLMAYRIDSGLTEVAPNGRPTEFRFEGGRFSGSTGCNLVKGGYRVEGRDLHFGEGLAATRLACLEPLMQQERAIFKALRVVTGYRYQPGRLDLTDGAGEILLRFTQIGATLGGADNGADALEGRTWVVEWLADAEGRLVSPLPGTRIDLRFDPRGRISGSDGCNRYLSGLTRTPSALAFGPIATTRPTCTATDGRAEQARVYAERLGQVRAYRIEDGRLTLLDAQGAILMRLKAAPGE